MSEQDELRADRTPDDGGRPQAKPQSVAKIDDVIRVQIERGWPVTVLHLTEDDWSEVKDFKERFPVVAAASGEPSGDDRRPRYLQIPIERSFRDFSFAEFVENRDGQVRPAWVSLDAPEVISYPAGRISSVLGGDRYVDEDELQQINRYRAAMLAGPRQTSLLGGEPSAPAPPPPAVPLEGPSGAQGVERAAHLEGSVSIAAHAVGTVAGAETPLPLRAEAASSSSGAAYGQAAYGRGVYGGAPPPREDGGERQFVSQGPIDFGEPLTDGVGNIIEDGNGNPIEAGPRSPAYNTDFFGTPRETSPDFASARSDDRDEEGSGAVGGAPVNSFALNASSGPSGGTAPTSAQSVVARVALGPPPEVPEPGPALIEPAWVEGRLTLPKGVPPSDLGDDAIVSLVAAVRAGFVEFVEALARSGTNFHPAALRAIESVPELLSALPNQVRVFQMGHAVEHLEALQPVSDEELPEALRVQYRTLVGQFRRLVERFPDWRALSSKAAAEPLTEEQARQAVPAARELAAALATEAAAELADPEIVGALSDLTDAADTAEAAERRALDFDLVASINQIMTKLMQPVVFCWKEYGAGAWNELKKTPREAGASTVHWGKKIAFGVVAVAVSAGFFAAVAQLAVLYPALSWLPSVIAFLRAMASANG